MKDESKTKKQLISELNLLRQLLGELSSIPEATRNEAGFKDPQKVFHHLREHQEKFTKSFPQNSIPIGLTTLKDGRFVEVSEAFLKPFRKKHRKLYQGKALTTLPPVHVSRF